MRIAVCFSGIIRTGVHCVENIRRYIADLWPRCDFFIHTWDYETVKPYARSSWNDVPFVPRQSKILDLDKLEQFLNAYTPKSWKMDIYHQFIKEYPKTHGNVVWHTMSRCFELKKKYEAENNFTYDAVIKIRPDVIFPPNRNLAYELDNINLSDRAVYSDVYSLSRLDDVFWILNSEVADRMINLPYYFEKYENKDIIHSHNQIVLSYLQNQEIANLPTSEIWPQYTIYRPEAYMLDPMTDFKHCFNVDRIHYSNAHSEDEFKKIFQMENREMKFYD